MCDLHAFIELNPSKSPVSSLFGRHLYQVAIKRSHESSPIPVHAKDYSSLTRQTQPFSSSITIASPSNEIIPSCPHRYGRLGRHGKPYPGRPNLEQERWESHSTSTTTTTRQARTIVHR